MFAIMGLLFGVLRDGFRPRERLEAENLVLRHQLNVLFRQAPKHVRLADIDRALFVWLIGRN